MTVNSNTLLLERQNEERSLCGLMANALNCSLEATMFKIQLRSKVHFRIDTLEKGMNLFILPVK